MLLYCVLSCVGLAFLRIIADSTRQHWQKLQAIVEYV